MTAGGRCRLRVPQLPELTEVTLRQWIDSVWFRGLSRVSMMITGVLFTGFLVAWGVVAGDTTKRVVALEQSVGGVARAQSDRTADSEAFQTEVRSNIANVKSDLFKLKVDIGVVKGILQEMQHQDQAAADFVPLWVPTVAAKPQR